MGRLTILQGNIGPLPSPPPQKGGGLIFFLDYGKKLEVGGKSSVVAGLRNFWKLATGGEGRWGIKL